MTNDGVHATFCYTPHKECKKMSSEATAEYDETIKYDRVPDWHLEILEERMAHYAKEGMQGMPWEEVEKELFELLFSQRLLKN
jgi:hypothetical protein